MQRKYLEQTKQELRLRNYSFKTIKAYLGCLREYFDFKKFNLEKIDEENIKRFLLNKQDKNYSSQTINLYPTPESPKLLFRDEGAKPIRLPVRGSAPHRI